MMTHPALDTGPARLAGGGYLRVDHLSAGDELGFAIHDDEHMVGVVVHLGSTLDGGKSAAAMLGEAECASGKPGGGVDTSNIHAAPGPYLTSTPSPLRPFLRRGLRRECWPWSSCLRGRHIRRWAGRSCASEQQR